MRSKIHRSRLERKAETGFPKEESWRPEAVVWRP
jgi:hypothetical protein